MLGVRGGIIHLTLAVLLLLVGWAAPAHAGLTPVPSSAGPDGAVVVVFTEAGPVFFHVRATSSRSVWCIQYAYCGGDPVNRSDPSGLDWSWDGDKWAYAFGTDRDTPMPTVGPDSLGGTKYVDAEAYQRLRDESGAGPWSFGPHFKASPLSQVNYMGSDFTSYTQFGSFLQGKHDLGALGSTPSIVALGRSMPEADAGIVGELVDTELMERAYYAQLGANAGEREAMAAAAARGGGAVRAAGGGTVAFFAAMGGPWTWAAVPWGIDQGQAGVRQAAGQFDAQTYGGQLAREYVGGWVGTAYDNADVIAGGYGLARVGLSKGAKLLSSALARDARYVNLLDTKAMGHVIAGEGWGSGGHMITGSPQSFFQGITGKKTFFPVTWSRERILNAISDVATNHRAMRLTNPKAVLKGKVPEYKGSALVDGVLIEAYMRGDRIVSGYRLDGVTGFYFRAMRPVHSGIESMLRGFGLALP